jgi:LPS O-antigen subunit length determinant protein (WzzB/FepE family)
VLDKPSGAADSFSEERLRQPDPGYPAVGAGPARRWPLPDEISLAGLLTTLLRGWWLLVLVTLIAMLVAAAYLRNRVPLYTATMIIAPASRDLGAVNRLVEDLDQYLNLAALAETPVKLERISAMERYLQTFGSLALAERLQAEHGLLQQVFWRDWDEDSQTWKAPQGTLENAYYTLLQAFGFPGWIEPDLRSLAKFLGGKIKTRKMTANPMRRLRISNAKPELAATILELAHATTDRMLREAAQGRVDRQIANLAAELAGPVMTPTRREALETVLAEHHRTQALLLADLPFAAEIFDPVTVPATPTSANPIVVLALAGVVGLILGIFVVFLRAAFRH